MAHDICTVNPMKLGDYLQAVDKSTDEFGAEIGVSGATVRRWRLGRNRPNWTVLERIVRVTNGAVGPADFLCADHRSIAGNEPASVAA